MATGYTRQDISDSIANGNIIDATALDAEFNGLAAAFVPSTGHSHDGTTGNGGPISLLGPTQDVVVSAVSVLPKTTDIVDLGSSLKKFKSLTLSGALASGSFTTGDLTSSGTVIGSLFKATPGGGNPSYTFTGYETTGLHYYTSSNTLGLLHTGSMRLGITDTAITANNGAVFTGNGSGLTNLNATNLQTGTVNSARIAGTYVGITGVGPLASGSITSGFGSIDIGTDIFTGNGSGLNSLNANSLASGTVGNARLSGTYTNIDTISGLTLLNSTGVTTGSGSESAPAYSFGSDTNTGMYRDSADTLAFSTGGTKRVAIGVNLNVYDTGNITIQGSGQFSGSGAGLTSIPAAQLTGTINNARLSGDYTFTTLGLSRGSAAAPAFVFSSDTNTGMYSSGANVINWSTAGILRMTLTNAGVLSTTGGFSGDGSNLSALDAGNISTGTLATARMSTSTAARDWALARTSEASVGAVGTYAYLVQASATNTDIVAGTTYAGSGLRYTGWYSSDNGNATSSSDTDGATPSGTWMAMGTVQVSASRIRGTLFLRVS